MTQNQKWQCDDTIYAKKPLREPITYEQFLEGQLKSFSERNDLSKAEQIKRAEEEADLYFRAISTFSAKDENDIYIDNELLFSNLKI